MLCEHMAQHLYDQLMNFLEAEGEDFQERGRVTALLRRLLKLSETEPQPHACSTPEAAADVVVEHVVAFLERTLDRLPEGSRKRY